MRAFKRPLRLIFALALIAALVGWGLFIRERGLNDVQRENQRLREMISRLGTEFRVADVVVTAQQGPRGRQRTTMFRFQEYDRTGNALEPPNLPSPATSPISTPPSPPDDDYVGADPRGRSLHLFGRLRRIPGARRRLRSTRARPGINSPRVDGPSKRISGAISGRWRRPGGGGAGRPVRKARRCICASRPGGRTG